MDNLNAYRHVVGPEVRLRVKSLYGNKDEEHLTEVDKAIQAKRDELDRTDLAVIKDFYTEARILVHRGLKSGVLERAKTEEVMASTLSLPTL